MGFILKSAVDNFLNAPREDHRWMKSLTAEEVTDLLNDLRPRPKLWPTIDLHQKIAFYLGVTHESFSYWIDMGGGKTLLSLELFKYWRQCDAVRRMLVFVLSDKAFLTWERQIKKFEIGVPVTALEGSSKDKWRQFHKFGDGIILTTYPGAVAMCTAKVQGKQGRNKLKLQNELVDELTTGSNMLVMDESTRLGNLQSLSHQLCSRIGDQVDYRYALAGRPFGRDPTMLWAQQHIIDGGESLGETKGLFQAAFFTKEPNRFARSKYVFDFKFKKLMAPELSRLMQHRSITYEEHEYKIPGKVRRIIEPVRFGTDSQAYYIRAATELAKAKGNFKEMQNMFLKLRQITSGFLGFKNDDTGDKASIAFDTNPKLEKLIELIGGLRDDRKAVVFYDFTWSARQITDTLRNIAHVKHIWLWSGTKDARQQINRFLNDSACQVAVINNKVGAYSLDGLQEVANYVFYYESPVAVIDREQGEKRVNRPGQKRQVYIYDLVVEKSVDERILDFHREGQDLMTAVRHDPQLLLR